MSRDDVAIVADYADDCTESPSYGRQMGRDAVRNGYRHWFRAFPDFRAEFPDLVIAGDHVAMTIVMEGTDTGGFLGQAPTGRPFRLFIVARFTLDHGKIVYGRRVYDITGVLLQLAGGPDNADMAQGYRARLEGARLEDDLRIAAEVQQTLLPARRHEGLNCCVATASVPRRAIGGDFCDHFGRCEVCKLGQPLKSGPATTVQRDWATRHRGTPKPAFVTLDAAATYG